MEPSKHIELHARILRLEILSADLAGCLLALIDHQITGNELNWIRIGETLARARALGITTQSPGYRAAGTPASTDDRSAQPGKPAAPETTP